MHHIREFSSCDAFVWLITVIGLEILFRGDGYLLLDPLDIYHPIIYSGTSPWSWPKIRGRSDQVPQVLSGLLTHFYNICGGKIWFATSSPEVTFSRAGRFIQFQIINIFIEQSRSFFIFQNFCSSGSASFSLSRPHSSTSQGTCGRGWREERSKCSFRLYRLFLLAQGFMCLSIKKNGRSQK